MMARGCPVCGGKRHENIRRVEMELPEGAPLPRAYFVVACSRCGCCFADTSAGQEAYDLYYRRYNHYSGQDENKTFPGTFASILSVMNGRLGSDSSILDIGFGKGELLLHLRGLGYTKLSGIDPSRQSTDRLNRLGIPAYCKSIYDLPGDLSGRYDLVFLTSVVEHLLNPKAAVARAGEYLKDNGYMIIDLPDYSECDKISYPVPNQFNQEHINYFSRDSFTAMLSGTGLEVLESRQIILQDKDSLCSEYSMMFLLQKHQSSPCFDVKSDLETKRAIRRFFDSREEQRLKTMSAIAGFRERKTPLVIWGTGAFTQSLLASAGLAACNISAFADGNPLKQGTSISGMKIIPPDEIRNYPEAVIVICAMKHAEQIKQEITRLGLQNSVAVLQ